MLQDVILMSLIIILVPLCSVIVLRRIAKNKREKRPVEHFRLN